MITNNRKQNKPTQPEKKKILLMGHSDGLGGAQTAFRKLYDFACNEGHIVKVICLSDQRKEEQYFGKKATLECIAHTGPLLILRLKKTLRLLIAGIKVWRYRPNIFVGVGLNNSVNLIARFTRPNCFRIGHDYIAERPYDDPIWVKSKAIMNGIALQAPSMLEYWRGNGKSPKGINWLPCFPEPPVNDILKKDYGPNKGVIRIAYFGRLAGNKGLQLLLQALASPDIPSKVMLYIWGSGSEEINLKKLAAKLQLETRVQFLGGYPASEKGASLMASYDALVLCSTGAEGLPLILLEAMAYGLPFLSTNVGAIRDCCENNPDAILVQPTQEDIINGLSVLVQRIEAGDFNSKRLRRYYEHHFSYKIMATRWRNCFKDPVNFFCGL